MLGRGGVRGGNGPSLIEHMAWVAIAVLISFYRAWINSNNAYTDAIQRGIMRWLSRWRTDISVPCGIAALISIGLVGGPYLYLYTVEPLLPPQHSLFHTVTFAGLFVPLVAVSGAYLLLSAIAVAPWLLFAFINALLLLCVFLVTVALGSSLSAAVFPWPSQWPNPR